MNVYFLIGGGLALFTTLVHLIGGGKDIVKPLMQDESLSESVKLTMYACWHFVTIVMFVSGATLSIGAFCDMATNTVYITIASIYFTMSAIFLIITLFISKNRGLMTYPQWTLLLPIAMLCVFGIS